jgi:hypothetical protein
VADLSDLKTRIASELHRGSTLTTQIADAITTAIAFYRSHRFEFNEQQASFNTVASQEAYDSGDTGFPDDIGQIDSVRVTASGRVVPLEPKTLHEVQALNSATTTTGIPSGYCWYAQQMFFTPIPNAVYSTSISYQQRKDAPSGDSDGTTIWTNQCEALIRARAKKLICRDVTRDVSGFQSNQLAETEELASLKRESLQLQDEGGLAPNW